MAIKQTGTFGSPREISVEGRRVFRDQGVPEAEWEAEGVVSI